MLIRKANKEDFESIWPIFHDIVSAGETYAFDPETGKEQAYEIWMVTPEATYVIENDGEVSGTYYIRVNQRGPGSHVCNCGYMVSQQARRKGLATRMCEHSQKAAIELGFKAMRFNIVASTNEGAVRLCKKLGFEVVGRLPNAFNHPS